MQFVPGFRLFVLKCHISPHCVLYSAPDRKERCINMNKRTHSTYSNVLYLLRRAELRDVTFPCPGGLL